MTHFPYDDDKLDDVFDKETNIIIKIICGIIVLAIIMFVISGVLAIIF